LETVKGTLMNKIPRAGLVAGTLLSSIVLAGCVWRSDYDALQAQYQQSQAENQQLQSQLSAANAQVTRLQGAIKYTVNSDLLFPSGGWQMSGQGRQIIANLARKLASSQENKLLVKGFTDNTPVGPALQREGINSNQELSQKRAENVMQFLISQGFKPDLLQAQGFGDANPVASNDSPKGRAQNRRVEITLANPSS
jgi:chemotaxis protein MotB